MSDLIYTQFPSIKDLGQRLKGGKDYKQGVRGLMLHSTLAVNMDGVPLGVAKQTFFAFDEIKKKRDQANTNEPGVHKGFPIAEKASYRWLDHLQSLSKLAAGRDTQIVHLADREADIYEFFKLALTDAASFVVRSSHGV